MESAPATANDDDQNEITEVLVSFLSQWKVWFVTVGCLAVAVYALGGADEAPPGYPLFFGTFALLGLIYGMEQTTGLPNLVSRIWY